MHIESRYKMVCCNLFVVAYWMFTVIVSSLYSALTLSSVGIRWKCISDIKSCIDTDIINNTTRTGAVITSFVTMFQALCLIITIVKNRKRYQGYCIGSAFHVSIIMLWYAVLINTSSKKVETWTASSINDLFRSSYYLACVLAGIHISWILVMTNIIRNKRDICMGEV